MILSRVERTIQTYRLIEPGQTILVGVSGGLDSIALLHLLHGLSRRHHWHLALFHLDHQLRGVASTADADFVEASGWRLGLPVYRFRQPIRSLARSHGVSLEMAARVVRRQLAAEVCERIGAAAVAWGHHADDQVETVLMRLARGTGLEGLGGMSYREVFPRLTVIRPLLDERRGDLETFVRTHRLAWREDASNQSDEFARNRVRREVLPVLESSLNPQVREAIVRMSVLVQDEWSLLAERTGKLLAACRDPRSPGGLLQSSLSGLHVADCRRVLRRWLQEESVDLTHISFATMNRLVGLVRASGSSEVPLYDLLRVAVQGGRLVVITAGVSSGPDPVVLDPGPSRMELPEWGLSLTASIGSGYQVRAQEVGHYPAAVDLSLSSLSGRSLLLRPWRPGDRYQPLGLKGSVKLQDLFVNARVEKRRRCRIPVLAVGDQIAWVAGGRVAERFKVPALDAPSLTIQLDRLPPEEMAPPWSA